MSSRSRVVAALLLVAASLLLSVGFVAAATVQLSGTVTVSSPPNTPLADALVEVIATATKVTVAGRSSSSLSTSSTGAPPTS